MNFNNLKPYLLAILAFLVIASIYFIPVFQGKNLRSHDTLTWKGMSKEVSNYREKSGEEALWTNSMFGGMPAYLISVQYKSNLVKYIPTILKINHENPHMIVFMYFLGFYILLLAFGVNPWLAIVGGLAYGFSSYFIIIIDAGHVTKAIALGYMPAVIAGAYLAFSRKKILLGGSVFALFLALQMLTNHFQIVYYTFWMLLFYGIYLLITNISQSKKLTNNLMSSLLLETKALLKPFAALLVGLILAIGANFTAIYLTNEYGKDSMRGKSELTISDQKNETSGLDKRYATAWSYGKAETFNLFIPNLLGGSSVGELGTDSEVYKFLEENGVQGAKEIVKQMPLYWGTQTSTSGPVYIGAVVVFLFVFGMFFLKNSIKWWIFAVTIFSFLLAWGENFMALTYFFLDYVPYWNKFRVPSMILIMAQFVFPLLALLSLNQLLEGDYDKKKLQKSLYYALGITGGIALVFIVFSGAFFNFTGYRDAEMAKSGWSETLLEALRSDRQSLLVSDALRSLVLVIISGAFIWLYSIQKLSKEIFILLFGVLILADLWLVDKRFVNNDKFVREGRNDQAWQMTLADGEVLKDKDPNFRVLNLAVDPFNDASTSYYHKSIGGYHGAKMKRYQELIEYQILTEIQQVYKAFNSKPTPQSLDSVLGSLDVLNMLNMKYLIYNSQVAPLQNGRTNGNAWFVANYKIVANADEELTGLSNIQTKTTALIDKRFEKQLNNLTIVPDSLAQIALTEYKPNHLKYKCTSKTQQLAIFSEIYYDKGWNAYINGKPAQYIRANYVLRAMIVPEGTNEIEFVFEPKMYSIGNIVSLASSSVLFLLLFAALFFNYKGTKKKI